VFLSVFYREREGKMSSNALVGSAGLGPVPSLPKLGYSIKEAVQITGLSRATISKAISNKELEYYKFGKRKLMSLAHLEAFLKRYEKRLSAGEPEASCAAEAGRK
jgi:excisionase family DNA binding protein